MPDNYRGTNIIDAALLRDVKEEFRMLFLEELETVDSFSEVLPMTMRIDTRRPTLNLGMLQRIGGIKEWVDERELGGFEAESFSATVKDWEESIAVDRNDLEDDDLGVYTPLIQGIAQNTDYHYRSSVIEKLSAGFDAGSLCYDGQPFFDTAHPVRQADGSVATYSNAGTAVLAEASLKAAMIAPASWYGPTGRKLNIKYDTLIVPPALQFTAKKLLEAESYAGAGTYNEARGIVPNLLVLPELATATEWYLLDSRHALKAFILQVRKEFDFAGVTDPEDSSVFRTRKFMFGIHGRNVVQYGMWQTMYGSDGTV